MATRKISTQAVKKATKKKTTKKAAKKKTAKRASKKVSARSTGRTAKKNARKAPAKPVQKESESPAVEDDAKMGRPTVMTDAVLGKLRALFTIGVSDDLACEVVGIHRDSLYSYQKEHPEFLEEKKLLKQNPIISARKNVVAAIKRGDMHTTRWFLERRCKEEFGKTVDVTSGGEKLTGLSIGFVDDVD